MYVCMYMRVYTKHKHIHTYIHTQICQIRKRTVLADAGKVYKGVAIDLSITCSGKKKITVAFGLGVR